MHEDETLVDVGGSLIGLVGLEEIFEGLAGRDLSEVQTVKDELVEKVAERNFIPPGRRELYADAVFHELTRYLQRPRDGKGQGRTRLTWRGIPREQILWYPTVDDENCEGCKKCISFCSFGVFSYSRKTETITVTNPFACVVGCSLCATICLCGAISFPPMSYLEDIKKTRGA